MAGTVNTSQVLPFSIRPLKADGSPGKIDPASVVVASENETVLTIVDLNATADVIDGKVNPVMPPADPNVATRFTVRADANLGPDVNELLGFGEVFVTEDPNSMATTFEISFGPAVPKAPTPTPQP
jgi:hypothetical protein